MFQVQQELCASTPEIQQVWLSLNPLTCDCDLAWLYNSSLIVDVDNVTCLTSQVVVPVTCFTKQIPQEFVIHGSTAAATKKSKSCC